MQRSTTPIRREITHSRSRPVLRMALCVAMAVSFSMRSRTAVLVRSHSRAVCSTTGEPITARASAAAMPIARARQ